jgi:hypothetical protein
MDLALCFLLALLAGVAWLVLRQPAGSSRDSSESSESKGSHEYHAVCISSDGVPCAAVQGIFGERYLANTAPRFPLENCERASKCTCRYEHHDDRRAGRDRRDLWKQNVRVQGFVDDDRTKRSKKDRRSAETASSS